MNMLQMRAQKWKKDECKNSLSANSVAVLDVSFLRHLSGSNGNTKFYFSNLAICKCFCHSSVPWKFLNSVGQFQTNVTQVPIVKALPDALKIVQRRENISAIQWLTDKIQNEQEKFSL